MCSYNINVSMYVYVKITVYTEIFQGCQLCRFCGDFTVQEIFIINFLLSGFTPQRVYTSELKQVDKF